jgi:hypothetical protein
MRTTAFTKRNYVFPLFLLSIIFLVGCSKASKIVTKENTNVATLPGLYIDTATFHHWALKNDLIMFRFKFNDKHISLTGYAMIDSTNYDTTETLELIPSDKSFKIEASTLYLGNLRFRATDIAYVDSAARNNHLRYILFRPVNSIYYPGNIAYNVYVSNSTSVYAYTKRQPSKNSNNNFILVAYITGTTKPKSLTSKSLDPSPPAPHR